MSVEVAPVAELKSTVELPLFPQQKQPIRVEEEIRRGGAEIRREGERGEAEAEDDDADADDTSDTSSIGASSNSSIQEEGAGEEGEDEVQSSFSSLHPLDDSLPTKRGLSKFYSGKSKSFTNLSHAAAAKDLTKPENPFNKRRRILMAWSRRASCTSLVTIAEAQPKELRLPPLPPPDDCEEDDDDEGSEQEETLRERRPSLFSFTPISISGDRRPLDLSLRSPRSFSLSDLNAHA